MTKKHCLLVVNGDMKDYAYYDKLLNDVDVIIGVDGGLKHVEKLGLVPDVMVGDFDSVGRVEHYLDRYPEAHVERFEVRKDYTDSELGVNYALTLKPEKITIIGGIGSRMDHTLATISLLDRCLKAGVDACVVDEHNEIHLMDDFIEIQGEPGELLSILPVTATVEGIDLCGLEYPLENATLLYGSSTGISNVFLERKATVKIRSGKLLVIKSRD